MFGCLKAYYAFFSTKKKTKRNEKNNAMYRLVKPQHCDFLRTFQATVCLLAVCSPQPIQCAGWLKLYKNVATRHHIVDIVLIKCECVEAKCQADKACFVGMKSNIELSCFVLLYKLQLAVRS